MSETLCGKPAVAVYVWPTMDELPVCLEHEGMLLNTAAALGCRVGKLPMLGEPTCSQKIKAPA